MLDAVLFHDDQLGGAHVHIHEDVGNLNSLSNFNNETSSIVVRPGSILTCYGGERQTNSGKTKTPVVLKAGSYYTDELEKMGLANDDLSSVTIKAG